VQEALSVEHRAKRSFAPTIEMLIPVSRATVAICWECAAARDAGGIMIFLTRAVIENDAMALTRKRHGHAGSRKFKVENETNP